MTAKVGVVAQILGIAGVVTTARELPLIRMLLAELDPMCATGVIWLTDAATLPTDLVATDTEFSVRIAADGAVLELGVLYLVPAHCCAWFEGRSIRIGSRSEVEAGAVDYFLSSMSIAWGPRSAALVPRIAGTADGEEGLARVSRAQGIAVGPAAFALLREAGTVRESALKGCAHWEPIRQFQARFHGAATAAHPLSIARLFLLHPLSLDARAVCSAAIWNAKEGGRIKMWLPGCRTGELIYAMAMLLAEATLRRGRASLRLQIFGTDTDETALAFARAARYPVGAALGMDPELRGRYTFDAGETIRISEQLRQTCVFSRHDLHRDAPLSGMDIVVCDRVLEGLESRDREAAINALHFSLKTGGLLFSLDHTTAFPVDRFAVAGPGCLRACVPPAKQRAPVRMSPPSIIPIRHRKRPLRARTGIDDLQPAKGNGDLVVKSQTLRATNRALRDSEIAIRAVNDVLRAANARREQEFITLVQMHANLEALVRSVGVPLVLCDEALRVRAMSDESCAAFALTPEDLGATLAELQPRVPGGSDLLDAARHTALGGETLELTIRKDQSVYLARLSASKCQGIALVFTDVSTLESAKVQAFAQRDQQVAIARLGALASDETRHGDLFEAALGILFGTLQVCSFGLILEATGGDGRNLEVVAARGFGAESLKDLCPPDESDRLLEAVSDREFAVFQSTLSFARHGLACPIFNEGMLLGVLALYAEQPVSRATAHRPFTQAVANLLGAAVARQRTTSRLALQLDVSNVLAGALDLDAVGDGVASVLRAALAIDDVEFWMLEMDAGVAEWRRKFPRDAQAGAGPARFGATVTDGPDPVYRASEQSAELVVRVLDDARPVALLRLRGEALRTLNAELRVGLQCSAILIGKCLDRLRT